MFQSAVRMRWCADSFGVAWNSANPSVFQSAVRMRWCADLCSRTSRRRWRMFQSAVRMRWCADVKAPIGAKPCVASFNPPCGCVGALTHFRGGGSPWPSRFNPPCGCVGALTLTDTVEAGLLREVSIRRADALVR